MKLSRLPFVAAACLALGCPLRAENWPQWRGPHYNGSTDEKGLPSKWSKESVTWSVAMPGPSAGTPAIWDDRVFVTTADNETRTLHALCLDRKSGKLLWKNQVSEGLQRDEKSNFASPSPVAGADRVFFFYGNGALAAFDHGGKELWSRNIAKDYGEFAFQWTFSASPTLYNGKLYLQVLQRNTPVNGHGRADGPIDSFLLALDPATGKTLWRQVRPSDAVGESHEAYTTPILFDDQGRKEIVIAGGDCLTAHDPETGAELWRWATYNPMKIGHWRLVPSPVTGGGVVLVCAPKADPVFAIKPGNGTFGDSAVAWKSEKRVVSSDVPTPLFYEGDFYILSEGKKSLSRVEPATGNVKWTRELPGFRKFEASPTAADGKIYAMDFAGTVVALDAAKGEILGSVAMGEEGDDMTRSSIAISHGQLFIRTNHKLFCVGGK
ncbi:MAG TPA: PQQ-binding-like beta-propeller repeat protein [Verrucomicrobiae bacterium]|nr:PQQ-binding-like beta-propeller repeat protein [Verrucomicrobiae bacterium]